MSSGDQEASSGKSIIFYTSRITPSCRAVRMLATHLNINLQEVYLRCYIDTRTEKFRKINPCHTLPVIDDNGFILWESRAIMQYFCNRYAPQSSLYPSDPKQRATVDRLLNFDLKTLSHAVMAVHYEFTFPGEYSASRGEKLVAVTDALTLLEIFLINRNYVACDHLTIADLSILASVTLLEIAVEFDLTSYPNIWNWYTRLRSELPYYDPLTKVAHDELRALIRNIRDAHEEWSSPLQQCAFVPNGSHADCHAEQRRQYQRLFLNANDKQDAARIMAAVSPVFRKSYGQAQVGPTAANSKADSFRAPSRNDTANSPESQSDSNSEKQLQQQQMVHKSFSMSQSSGANSRSGPLMKRIRLTIEPNTGQCLQLGHLDSPPVQEGWSSSSSQPSPLDTLLLSSSSNNSSSDFDERIRKVSSGSHMEPCCASFSENYHLCNETFCHNC